MFLLICTSLPSSVGLWEWGQEYCKIKKSKHSVALVFLSLPAGCWDPSVPPSPSSAAWPALAPVLRQALARLLQLGLSGFLCSCRTFLKAGL